MKASCSILFWCFTTLFAFSCKKTKSPPPDPVPPTDTPVVVKPVTDPDVANTVDFFLNDWQAKTFTVPAYTEARPVTATTNNIIKIKFFRKNFIFKSVLKFHQ